MSLLAVEHVTQYRYVAAVEPAQHLAYLQPREGQGQQVEAFDPVQLTPDLVDLVHRQDVPADGDGGRAGKDQLSAGLPAIDDGPEDL